MKLAFLIMRSPEYRVYGPVIDAALAEGHEVECWHDYGQLRTGMKGYQFPDLSEVPTFRHGVPTARSFGARDELRQWLAEERADAVVAWETADAAVGGVLPDRRPVWVSQQYNLDTFFSYGPESLRSADLLTLYSSWWLEWAATYFAAEGRVADAAGFLREFSTRSVAVGMPEMDAAAGIDPHEVRRRWKIPAAQPVVVLFAFPQGVGRDIFWPRQIYAEPSRLKQLMSVARRRRFEYLPDVWHGRNDRRMVQALRDFCDRHGAFLLIKSRRKTPVPEYAQALADLTLYDEAYYPSTVLDALSVASLSVGYYSTSVFESVSMGVPHLSLAYTSEDYNGAPLRYFDTFYTATEGGPFQFRGATTAWSIPSALERLPGASMSDFSLDPSGRQAYLERFLTRDDREASGRAVAAIEHAVAMRRRR